MSEDADNRTLSAEDSPTEVAPAASVASPSPLPSSSEGGSDGGSSFSTAESPSQLLNKIRQLQETQKALKEQKRACAKEIKNAQKRKKRLQGKAMSLSDADLVEVLRMRKARKDGNQRERRARQHQRPSL